MMFFSLYHSDGCVDKNNKYVYFQIITEALATEGEFDGNAYAEYLLHKTPVKSSYSNVSFAFRTIQPNGLLLHGDSKGDELMF